MKKLFILSFMLCLLGGNRAWAAISFTQNSVILNSGTTSFDFTSIPLNGQVTDLVTTPERNDPWNNGNYFENMESGKFSSASVGDIIRVNVSEVGTVIDTDHFVEFKKYQWHTDIDEEFSTKLIRDPEKGNLPVNKYFQATITTPELLNKIQSEGMSIQYKNYTITSIQHIHHVTWKAEVYGDVVINSGFVSKSDNIYNLDPSQASTISFTGGGAIAIIAEGNGERAYYMITVPYTYNEDNGYQHIWNYYDQANPTHSPEGFVNDNHHWELVYKNTSADGNKKYRVWAAKPSTTTDGHNSVDGNNAYYIPSTAGLVFNTDDKKFGVDNGTEIEGDDNAVLTFGGNGASITIPQVPAGYYVRIWWDAKQEGGRGANFLASNVRDLDGVEITNGFTITGITNQAKGANLLGNTIFKVKEAGDVTFTLADEGWNDIYKIQVMKDYETDLILVDETGGWSDAHTVLYNNEFGNIVYQEGTGSAYKKKYDGAAGKTHCQRAKTSVFEVAIEPYNQNDPWVTSRQEDWTHDRATYKYLWLENFKGSGNVRIIQRVFFSGLNSSNSNYVLDKKESWIAVGTYKQQTYPYTWDFMDWNMKQKKMLGVLDDSNNHGISYGYWNTTSDNVRSLETHESVAASKVNNEYVSNYVWNNVQVDRPLFAQGAQLSYRYVDDSKNIDEIRALKEAEGLRVKQFCGSEVGAGSTYDNEISLDGNYLSFNPTTTGDDGHKLVITIPNVPKKDGEEMWLFIKASTQPNGVYASTNTSAQTLTADSKETGSDTYNTKDDVWAYKITSAGDVEILYSKAVNIAAIGVTNIFKSINDLGYATESRNVAIDHEYEGVFTKNDVNAYCILTYANDGFTYEYKGLPEVKKSTRVHLVPKNTGIVLYADVKNSEGKFNVPLFYPACNNTSLPADEDDPEVKAFRNNWMAPWVNAEQHYNDQIQKEWAMHRYDDNSNDYKDKGEWCQKFVMSSKYYVYHKASDGTGSYSGMLISTNPTTGQKTEAFYRMNLNLANTGVSGTSNVMGANKAYLLIPSSKMPKALWNDGDGNGNAGSSKNGIIFMDLEDIFGPEDLSGVATSIDAIESADSVDNGNTYYTLSGMKIQGRPTEKGVYIMNGKKVLVK